MTYVVAVRQGTNVDETGTWMGLPEDIAQYGQEYNSTQMQLHEEVSIAITYNYNS